MYIFNLSFLILTSLKVLARARAMSVFFAFLKSKNPILKFAHLFLHRSLLSKVKTHEEHNPIIISTCRSNGDAIVYELFYKYPSH